MENIATAPTIACTLDTGRSKERREWIADLNTRALTSSRRGDLTLTLEYRPTALDDVRELVRREQACCAFLNFNLREGSGKLVLAITAPEAARDAASMLFDHFEANKSSCGCGAGSGCRSTEERS